MLQVQWLTRMVAPARVWRLTLYLAGVFFVLSLVTARLLRAQTREALLGLGHQISGLTELTSGAETLLVNGQRFHHAVVTLEEPLTTVLDRVEHRCVQSPGLLARALAPMPLSGHTSLPEWARKASVLREEAGQKGMLVCFVKSQSEDSRSIGVALERLTSQSDASELGAVIYTFAEHADGRTRVSTIWTDSGLNFFDLFGAEGDAHGTDSSVLPRPPHARRTLVVAADGAPFGVRVYESSESVDAIRSYYAQRMQKTGSRAVAENREYETTAFLRNTGELALVSLSVFGDRTYVTLTEAGRMDATVTALAAP